MLSNLTRKAEFGLNDPVNSSAKGSGDPHRRLARSGPRGERNEVFDRYVYLPVDGEGDARYCRFRQRPLPRRKALGEGRAPAKRPRTSTVPHPHDAYVVYAGHSALARRARRHLHRQREVAVGGQAEAPEAQAGHVLRNIVRLEGGGLGPARGTVHGGREGSGAVLVDLAVNNRVSK